MDTRGDSTVTAGIHAGIEQCTIEEKSLTVSEHERRKGADRVTAWKQENPNYKRDYL